MDLDWGPSYPQKQYKALRVKVSIWTSMIDI